MRRFIRILLVLIFLLCLFFVLSYSDEWKQGSGNEIRSEQHIGFYLSPWVIIKQTGHLNCKDMEWKTYDMEFNIFCWSTVILAAGLLALIGSIKMQPSAAHTEQRLSV